MEDWINHSNLWHGSSYTSPEIFDTTVMRTVSRIDFNKGNWFLGGIQLSDFAIVSCTFLNTEFCSANFTTSILEDSHFGDCNFQGVNFTHARIRGTKFNTIISSRTIDFRRANFASCEITEKSRFENANFIESIFLSTKIRDTIFIECTFSNCVFVNTKLSNVEFIDCKFNTVISNSNLKNVKFINSIKGIKVLDTEVDNCTLITGIEETLIEKSQNSSELLNLWG